jgi:hypothetical protein
MPVPPWWLWKILTKNRESVECSRDRHGGYPASSCFRSLNHYMLWSPTLVPEGPQKSKEWIPIADFWRALDEKGIQFD